MGEAAELYLEVLAAADLKHHVDVGVLCKNVEQLPSPGTTHPGTAPPPGGKRGASRGRIGGSMVQDGAGQMSSRSTRWQYGGADESPGWRQGSLLAVLHTACSLTPSLHLSPTLSSLSFSLRPTISMGRRGVRTWADGVEVACLDDILVRHLLQDLDFADRRSVDPLFGLGHVTELDLGPINRQSMNTYIRHG